MVAALTMKLGRDLVQLRGPVLTIALVVACGIASFAAAHSTYRVLERSRASYYDANRFADVFAHAEHVPAEAAERIRQTEGVAAVTTRITESVRVPIEGMTEPATALLVSIADAEQPLVNALYLRSGRLPSPSRTDEAVALESFAQANGIALGDRLPVVVNGELQLLRIVGIALSPEFVFASAPNDPLPDERLYGVLWIDEAALAAAYQMTGAFNDVVLRLRPGVSEAAVIDELDRLLARYGGYGAYGRSRQLSHRFVENELRQLSGIATVVPAIFLGVAAFLVNVVLSRLVQTQRLQIATLRAIGYGAWEIGLHYLELVGVIVLLGAAAGALLGAWIGRYWIALYADFFRFPVLAYRLDPGVATTAILVSLASAALGALGVVRAVTRLPPAQAMQPPAPAVYGRDLLSRLGLDRLLGPAARMVARELVRRPLRTTLSVLGVGAAAGILVVSFFIYDAVQTFLTVQFQIAQTEDVAVSFIDPLPARDTRSLAALPGVLGACGLRAVPVRFRRGQISRDGVLYGYADGCDMRRVVEWPGRVVPLAAGGAVITATLAEILGAAPGDRLRIELQSGDRSARQINVVSLAAEPMGLAAHMRQEELDALLGEETLHDVALLRIDPRLASEVDRRLAQMPAVAAVTRREAALAKFREQSGESFLSTAIVLTLFAASIAVGMVYNTARIALALRRRELATLRVLGFSRHEVSSILLGELAAQVVLGLPVGGVLGRWLALGVAALTDPELYRFPALVSTRTYVLALSVVTVAAAASAFFVLRRLERLDLVAVLKTRE